MTLVANKPLRTPPSRFIHMVRVPRGTDVADNEIARRVEPGDLVITADIPLAAGVIGRGAHALDPRGEFYTPDTIGERLACAISWMLCAAAACIPAAGRATGRSKRLADRWTVS